MSHTEGNGCEGCWTYHKHFEWFLGSIFTVVISYVPALLPNTSVTVFKWKVSIEVVHLVGVNERAVVYPYLVELLAIDRFIKDKQEE